MRISDRGLQFIKEVEGCVLHVYKDAGGLQTIGIGHLLTKEEKIGGKFADGITEAEALELLRKDVSYAESAVNDNVTIPIEQYEFDALVSFVFNVGAGAFRKSTLLKKLNLGNIVDVPAELRKWVRCGGKRNQGLAHRREKEVALWKGNL